MDGVFITFEGGEGAGKSTQARKLAERLRTRGQKVVLTREPGGSPFAERLRAALLTDRGRALSPADQAILFAAARADHVDTVIRPALEAGTWVISDRFADSTAAYQGAAGAPEELLRALSTVAVGDTQPDLTLLLDVPPAIGLARAGTRSAPDAFERDTLAVHEARRAAFLAIAEREPERVVVLDGAASEEALADAVWHAVAERFDLADDTAVAPARSAAEATARAAADAPARAQADAADRSPDPAPEPPPGGAPSGSPEATPDGAPDRSPRPEHDAAPRPAPQDPPRPAPNPAPDPAPDTAPVPPPEATADDARGGDPEQGAG